MNMLMQSSCFACGLVFTHSIILRKQIKIEQEHFLDVSLLQLSHRQTDDKSIIFNQSVLSQHLAFLSVTTDYQMIMPTPINRIEPQLSSRKTHGKKS